MSLMKRNVYRLTSGEAEVASELGFKVRHLDSMQDSITICTQSEIETIRGLAAEKEVK